MTYIHPEDDIKLRTWNWLLDVDEHYQIIEYTKTDTSKFDTYEPKWDFVGLEDARLVRWDDKLFQVGVRRDTTTNGQGRMELSEIDENGVEISRQRIPTPSENSYCEKNWMPVLDQPYTFIKWSNPTEIVRYNPKTKKLDGDKHWWPQAEALVGLKYAYEITKDEKYLQKSLAILNFIQKNIIDKTNGEWFWRVDKNRNVCTSDYKMGIWKAPYHNSRACMILNKNISI